MEKFGTEELFKRIEETLSSSKNVFSIALLCDSPVREQLQQLLIEKFSVSLVLMDTAEDKHKLKRLLNERGCEMMLYTTQVEPMVDEILNDGTTLLREVLNVESFFQSK